MNANVRKMALILPLALVLQAVVWIACGMHPG